MVVTDAGIRGGKDKKTAMRKVVITVTNVKEIGTVTLSTLQPKIGVPITASVTDLDGGVANVKWQWWSTISTAGTETEAPAFRNDDAAAEINTTVWAKITGAESNTYEAVKKDNDRWLVAMASYTDQKGADTANVRSAAAVDVRTDNAPKFPDTENGKRSIPENSAADTAVGDPVVATDDDGNDILTYSLSGADAGSFAITQDDLLTTDDR